MSATSLDRLAEKVRQAAAEITRLKKDRGQLTDELEILREENRRARRLAREHGELVSERERIRTRLEKYLGKLERIKL